MVPAFRILFLLAAGLGIFSCQPHPHRPSEAGKNAVRSSVKALDGEEAVPAHTSDLVHDWPLPVARYGRPRRACAVHVALNGDKIWFNGELIPEKVAPNDHLQKIEGLAKALEQRPADEDRTITWWVHVDTPIKNFKSAFLTAAFSRYSDGRIMVSGPKGEHLSVELGNIVPGHPRRLTPVDLFFVVDPPRIEAWRRQGAVGKPFDLGSIENGMKFFVGLLDRAKSELDMNPSLRATARFYIENSLSMTDLAEVLGLFGRAAEQVSMPGNASVRVGLAGQPPSETVHWGLPLPR